MQAHQQRVVDEKAELDQKLAALRRFFGTEIYARLPEIERHLLFAQSQAMATYSMILGERIDAF